uniref:Uncharacterized protein n=1 Tax=Schistosoma haematobium TaxID=6185 RepID=A0A094ZRH9_SCHHA
MKRISHDTNLSNWWNCNGQSLLIRHLMMNRLDLFTNQVNYT